MAVAPVSFSEYLLGLRCLTRSDAVCEALRLGLYLTHACLGLTIKEESPHTEGSHRIEDVHMNAPLFSPTSTFFPQFQLPELVRCLDSPSPLEKEGPLLCKTLFVSCKLQLLKYRLGVNTASPLLSPKGTLWALPLLVGEKKLELSCQFHLPAWKLWPISSEVSYEAGKLP